MTPYTGYDITNPKNRFLNEIFKGTNRTAAPNKLLLYRLGATGQKQASAEVSPPDGHRKVSRGSGQQYLHRHYRAD